MYIMYLFTSLIINIQIILISLHLPSLTYHPQRISLHLLTKEVINILIINLILHRLLTLPLIRRFKVIRLWYQIIILNYQLFISIEVRTRQTISQRPIALLREYNYVNLVIQCFMFYTVYSLDVTAVEGWVFDDGYFGFDDCFV